MTPTSSFLTAGVAGASAPKVTDPRSWSAADRVTDLVPQLAYGAVTAVTLKALR